MTTRYFNRRKTGVGDVVDRWVYKEVPLGTRVRWGACGAANPELYDYPATLEATWDYRADSAPVKGYGVVVAREDIYVICSDVIIRGVFKPGRLKVDSANVEVLGSQGWYWNTPEVATVPVPRKGVN